MKEKPYKRIVKRMRQGPSSAADLEVELEKLKEKIPVFVEEKIPVEGYVEKEFFKTQLFKMFTKQQMDNIVVNIVTNYDSIVNTLKKLEPGTHTYYLHDMLKKQYQFIIACTGYVMSEIIEEAHYAKGELND